MSASDAAEDRAKGIKREGGIIIDTQNAKSNKIEFVKQGKVENSLENKTKIVEIPDSDEDVTDENLDDKSNQNGKDSTEVIDEKFNNGDPKEEVQMALSNIYLEELSKIKCLDIRCFNRDMFMTSFGKFVLLVRSWAPKLSNIQGMYKSILHN